MATLEDYRGIIFFQYIAQKKPLSDVIDCLANEGCEISPPRLKRKLKKWGYSKNMTAPQAVAIMQKLGSRQQPVNPQVLAKLDRYYRRKKLESQNTEGSILESLVHNSAQDAEAVDADSSLALGISNPAAFQVLENFFYNNESLIKGSFESGAWSFHGYDLLIFSSPDQEVVLQSIHAFRGNLEVGITAASSGDYILARYYWDLAFAEVDTMVKADYHDTIPNIIQKINDLNTSGFHDLAAMLKNFVAAACAERDMRTGPKACLLLAFAQLSLSEMVEIEDRIMQSFSTLFSRYLGAMHYNSFVMMMNSARRRLLRDHWTRLEDHIPPLTFVDHAFGLLNVRALEIVRHRVEILYLREDYVKCGVEAAELLRRALLLVDDVWQCHYFGITGYYYVACAQRALQDYREPLLTNVCCALEWIESFSNIEDADIFKLEKLTLVRIREDLQLSCEITYAIDI